MNVHLYWRYLIIFNGLLGSIDMAKLGYLLKALLKNDFKVSTKKCQLFRKELQCIENTSFIKERRVCLKPLRSRLNAIQK